MNIATRPEANTKPEFRLVPLSQAQNVPRKSPAGTADAGADSDDSLWDAPMSEHFRGAEKLLRPAHEYADALDAQIDKAGSAVDDWFGQDPNTARIFGATLAKSLFDLARSEADLLRFGEGIAEGGVGGVAEDALRAAGLVGHMAGPGRQVLRKVLPSGSSGAGVSASVAENIPSAYRPGLFSRNPKGRPKASWVDNIPHKIGDVNDPYWIDNPAVLGKTDPFGNIELRPGMLKWERDATLRHESVHHFLSPKSGLLRGPRAEMGMAAYRNSPMIRYLEEAMAEAVKTESLLKGISYPITVGEVTPWSLGMDAAGHAGTVGRDLYTGHKLATGE